jgi:cob(I)alamin adenosyltransferase
MEKGLIQIYCGDGKGKTTAALGLSVRALGSGMNVLFVQFLKSVETGELNTLAALSQIRVLRGTDKSLSAHNSIFREAVLLCRSGQAELLVLDEVIGAYNRELVDREALLDFLRNKPEFVEVVLTGRNPPQELLELADYVSEIRKAKHPFDRGISARKGIEL